MAIFFWIGRLLKMGSPPQIVEGDLEEAAHDSANTIATTDGEKAMHNKTVLKMINKLM